MRPMVPLETEDYLLIPFHDIKRLEFTVSLMAFYRAKDPFGRNKKRLSVCIKPCLRRMNEKFTCTFSIEDLNQSKDISTIS